MHTSPKEISPIRRGFENDANIQTSFFFGVGPCINYFRKLWCLSQEIDRINDRMKAGCVDDEESDTNGSDSSGHAQAVVPPDEMAPPPHSREQSILPDNSVQDESSNVGSSTCQSCMDEDKEVPHNNPLLAPVVDQAVNPQEGKCLGSVLTQPGAVAIAGGVNERNTLMARGQDENRDLPNEVLKATGTMVIGMDQGETASGAMGQRITNRDSSMASEHTNSMLNSNVAELSDEGTMHSTIVEAELVMPPVEAVRVSIDEDPSLVGSPYPFELEHAPSREHADENARRKRFGPTIWVLLALLIVAALCGIMIPYTVGRNANSKEESASPSLPTGCYTSLLDIFMAQISDSVDAPTYVICPNTKIKIGTLNNPATHAYEYVDGDYPIIVIRENVTIQCGWDGRRDNNCVLDAGFMHVLTLQVVPMPDGSTYTVNSTNDNLVIRGITFTGILLNVEPFRGSSISLSHPGQNMRFEHCLWYNVTAESGLIGVYRNYFQVLAGLPLEDQSIDVTFADCTFQNVVYDSPLILINDQAIHLERCTFLDIQLSLLLESYCRYTYSDVTADVVETDQGCASLLLCASQSYCSMKDVCVHGVEIWSEGIIVIENDTIFEHDGLFLGGPMSTNAALCELATVTTIDATNFTCTKIFDEPSCPLLP